MLKVIEELNNLSKKVKEENLKEYGENIPHYEICFLDGIETAKSNVEINLNKSTKNIKDLISHSCDIIRNCEWEDDEWNVDCRSYEEGYQKALNDVLMILTANNDKNSSLTIEMCSNPIDLSTYTVLDVFNVLGESCSLNLETNEYWYYAEGCNTPTCLGTIDKAIKFLEDEFSLTFLNKEVKK